MLFPGGILPVGTGLQPVNAIGGNIVVKRDFKIHIFDASGTFQVLSGGPVPVEYLIVAGGGGGGGNNTGTSGGGAGAGGMLVGKTSVGNGSWPVTIGAGGTPGLPGYALPTNGGNSSFIGATATGGGTGGNCEYDGSQYFFGYSGGDGGSGGGSGYHSAGTGLHYPGHGIPGQGNDGYDYPDDTYPSAGGGARSAAAGYNPGLGRTILISGVPNTWSSGGGISSSASGPAGTGAGGWGGASNWGGSGGTGMVIVRYPWPAASVGGNDIYTVSLLHFDTDFSDAGASTASPITWLAAGTGAISIDATQSKFGGKSARITPSSYLYPNTGFVWFWTGIEDFTIDFWVRFNSVGSVFMYDGRSSGGTEVVPVIYINVAAGNVFEYFVGGVGTVRQSSVVAVPNTWYHVAATRSGLIGRFFINGVQQGASYSEPWYYAGPEFRPLIGAALDGSAGMDGWIEEFRFSNGIARWTSNFTPPTVPYTL